MYSVRLQASDLIKKLFICKNFTMRGWGCHFLGRNNNNYQPLDPIGHNDEWVSEFLWAIFSFASFLHLFMVLHLCPTSVRIYLDIYEIYSKPNSHNIVKQMFFKVEDSKHMYASFLKLANSTTCYICTWFTKCHNYLM